MFEYRIQREYFDLRGRKARGWKNGIMRSFIICSPPPEMITQQIGALHDGQDV
jgi:hypothetical protein